MHWETDSRRARIADVVKEATFEPENKPVVTKKALTKVVLDKTRKEQVHVLGDLRISMPHTNTDKKAKLGQYLFNLARVADAIDYEADERLLRENLHLNPPLSSSNNSTSYHYIFSNL